MNMIAKIESPAVTMTSQEIAELTGKEHKNVTRDIENMLDDLKEDRLRFERIYFDSMNRAQKEYVLDRELTETLLTGYSAVLRRKVIARWRELETQTASPIPRTMAQALRLAAEQAEMLELQAEQLVLAGPKVEFVDRYVESTGSKGFRQVCKLLGANESEFREFLLDKKIMYRLGGEWTPHGPHLDAGRFEVKTGTSDVSSHAFNQAKFTPKGVQWVAGLWIRAKSENQVEA